MIRQSEARLTWLPRCIFWHLIHVAHASNWDAVEFDVVTQRNGKDLADRTLVNHPRATSMVLYHRASDKTLEAPPYSYKTIFVYIYWYYHVGCLGNLRTR